MKKILFITHSIGFGGAEKILTFIANSLSERDYSCGIVNLNCAPDYVHAYQRSVSDAVKVYVVPPKSERLNKNLYYIREIKRFAKAFGADILVGFTAFPNMYAKIVGAMLGIPSVMSERGDPGQTMGNGLKSRLMLAIINSSRGGVFQTDGARQYYSKALRKRGTVIPNPIFIQGELPSVAFEEREKSVVSVGRLDNYQKRYDVMIKAFALFSRKHPDYVLKLYGTGSDVERIREWAREHGVEEKVKFMGVTKTAMQDICRDGMFLITSDFEGISNSLLEAMAVGLPCVSTDHSPGGARLLITHGENGLLAPVEDHATLAEAMGEFADSPALAKRCGEQAKEVVNCFAPERIIDLWEAYLQKTADRNNR